ncbi:hypothetical protein F4813DRAFT_365112 [Daldinia decipiens]|uniref:uncharacterized protein n=1 Tax=Daldinia decipiens TaxID=326647 RepID=UPI0020C31886|nr:uncharacterized protein F4813DRAFT_365112 [Daldinia decipiens]KAI1656045.1 hypothetical protein F4813DRAFT_365112 [Daldinia decipiens]
MATPTPALPPPPGVTSDFVNPPSLVKEMNIAIAIAVPLIMIFFGLRTYVRIFIRRTWTFEDWLALTAWVGTVSFAGVGAATMAHNGGKHGWDITPAQAQEASYWFNVASIHYGITICVAKLSVLWLYRRIFSPQRATPFDITIVFLIVLLIMFYTAINIVKIWECVPREKILNDKIPGSCINTPILLNTSGIFNTVTDLIILLLPVRAVWGLNMSPREKVAVVLVFTFGLSAPAFSLAGTIVRLQGTNNPDKTWVQPDIIMWGLAELTTGILCVSFPETGLLWKKKEHPGPTASILNGRYRFKPPLSRRKQGTGFSTVMSRSTRQLDSETHIELEEADVHGNDTQQEDRGDSHHYKSNGKFTSGSR